MTIPRQSTVLCALLLFPSTLLAQGILLESSTDRTVWLPRAGIVSPPEPVSSSGGSSPSTTRPRRNKKGARPAGDARPVTVDHVGLKCPDRYLFGRGMDYRGYWRNLGSIYALPDDFEGA